MGPKAAAGSITELSVLQQSIQTASHELAYERSSREVAAAIRDEDVRKLKFQLIVLEDENDVLDEQLSRAEENAEALENDLGEALARQGELESEFQTMANELRTKLREAESMRAELAAFENITNDSNKLLKEKFSLQTEISKMKPELDHLRTESTMHQELLSEKLSLQRQLNTVQVELENAQRAAERAKTKAGKSNYEDAEREAQLDDLHKQLAEAKQSLKEATREADRLRKEVASEKKAVERAEAKRSKKSEIGSELEDKVEELRESLAAEKKERERVEKALEKERQAWEAEKSLKEDKLAQFRSKLKTTKDDKTALEVEVKRLQEELAKAPAPAETTKPSARNPRKRQAAQMDPDAAIGTPGDAAPTKSRKRTAASIPGEKSMFSITPFLNRTMSVAPDSPSSDKEDGEGDEPAAAPTEVVEAAAPSPSAPAASKKPTTASKKPIAKKPLAPAPSTKHNANPAALARKPKAATKPTLAQVTEEADENDNHVTAPPSAARQPGKKLALNDTTTTTTTTVEPSLKPRDATKKQPRKSLADFSTFALDADGKAVKKKRKLLGGGNTSSLLFAGASGAAKTLFDEDDADAPKPKPIPGRGLFAARGKAGGLLAAAAGKGPLVVEKDGFAFSPLKKDRRAAKLAASMLGE